MKAEDYTEDDVIDAARKANIHDFIVLLPLVSLLSYKMKRLNQQFRATRHPWVHSVVNYQADKSRG